jgi:tetratricopeptide (TPR) repeat protein
MFLRSLQRRRMHRLEMQQQELLGRIRAAIDALRFAEAFGLAEELLDLDPTTEVYEELLRPVDRAAAASDPPRLYEMLDRLERERDPAHEPWRLLLRCALLQRLDWGEEAFLLSAGFARQPPRYAWMRYNRAVMLMSRLHALDEAGTEIAAALQAAPKFWKASGTLAECALCQGREAEAFSQMDACVARLAVDGRPGDAETARVWRGELHLWLGHYPEAIADLAQGAQERMPYALIWGGAAHLLSGESAAGLALLDRAVGLVPRDWEAYVWRGEAHEQLAEWDLALADFDQAARLTATPFWPGVGRALAKLGGGDSAGALAAFRSLPRRITEFFQWKSDIRVADDAAAAAAILREMRRAARGLRRHEGYLEALWVRRTPLASAEDPPR